MTGVRVLSAAGMLGSGYLESPFERELSPSPHAVACDAGSTDGGPAALLHGSAAWTHGALPLPGVT